MISCDFVSFLHWIHKLHLLEKAPLHRFGFCSLPGRGSTPAHSSSTSSRGTGCSNLSPKEQAKYADNLNDADRKVGKAYCSAFLNHQALPKLAQSLSQLTVTYLLSCINPSLDLICWDLLSVCSPGLTMSSHLAPWNLSQDIFRYKEAWWKFNISGDSGKHVAQDLSRVRSCTQEKVINSGYPKKRKACWDLHHLGSWPMPKEPFSIMWACLENSDSFLVHNNSPLHSKKNDSSVIVPSILFGHQDYDAVDTDSVEDFQNRISGERNVGGSYTNPSTLRTNFPRIRVCILNTPVAHCSWTALRSCWCLMIHPNRSQRHLLRG